MSYDRKAFSLLKAEQDVDDSKWETSKDGTVVKKQPGLYNLLDCGLYWTVVFTVLLDPGLFYYSFIGPSVTLACFNMLHMHTGGGVATGSHSGGTYIERITDDAREDEMEENMQAVCSSVFKTSFLHI